MTMIITFLNEKGGCGKTTSVLESAYHLGAAGNKVLVIDLDPQANATIMLTGDAKSRPNIFDLLTDEENELSIQTALKAAQNDWPGVLVLPSDRRLAGLETALQGRVTRELILKQIIKKIESAFDFIIIDLPPSLGIVTVNALVASHGYMIPTDRSEYSRAAIPGIQRLVSIIKKQLNPELKCLGIFLTGFEKGGSNAVRALVNDLSNEYKETFLPIKIQHSVKVIESQRAHKPVGLLSPESPVSSAYRELSNLLQGEKAC